MTTRCEAVQQGDEMQCGRCGLTWEVNDPERPACAPRIDRRAIHDRRITTAVKRLEGAQPARPDVLVVALHELPEDRRYAAGQLYLRIPASERAASRITVDHVEQVIAALERG